MKPRLLLAAIAGMLLAIALIAYHGFMAVFDALLSAGWGLIGVALFHLIPMLCSALGWRAVMRSEWRETILVFLGARWLREAINNLLPVAQVGGDIVGARVVTFHGASARLAGAGVIVDVTVEVLTQLIFTVMGLGLLILAGGNEEAVNWVLAGLAIVTPALIGFVLAQRWGLFKLLERLLKKLEAQWGWLSLGSLTNLHETVLALYNDRRGILASCVYHLLSWLTGVGEVWLALYFMGVEVTLIEAVILESLGQAVRTAAFLVPGALGVQEGGYVLLGALFQLSPEVALALSLFKRVRDLLLGLPAMLVWQLVEGKRLVGEP